MTPYPIQVVCFLITAWASLTHCDPVSSKATNRINSSGACVTLIPSVPTTGEILTNGPGYPIRAVQGKVRIPITHIDRPAAISFRQKTLSEIYEAILSVGLEKPYAPQNYTASSWGLTFHLAKLKGTHNDFTLGLVYDAVDLLLQALHVTQWRSAELLVSQLGSDEKTWELSATGYIMVDGKAGLAGSISTAAGVASTA